MALSLVTGPSVEPLTLVETKRHLKIDIGDDDALVQGLIAAARERAEGVTGRQLIQATWDLRLDAFPCEYEIQVPKPPLISVTYLKYTDTAGTLQTWASTNYDVDAPAGPFAARGRLRPTYATNWPTSRTDTMNAVVVRVLAGYGAVAVSVPMAIRQAMLLMIAAWFENRDDLVLEGGVAPLGALALLTPYKVYA